MRAWHDPARPRRVAYPTCCPLVRFPHIAPEGASKMLRATGHARMVCLTLLGPAAAKRQPFEARRPPREAWRRGAAAQQPRRNVRQRMVTRRVARSISDAPLHLRSICERSYVREANGWTTGWINARLPKLGRFHPGLTRCLRIAKRCLA